MAESKPLCTAVAEFIKDAMYVGETRHNVRGRVVLYSKCRNAQTNRIKACNGGSPLPAVQRSTTTDHQAEETVMAKFPKSIEVELDMKNLDEAMEKAESLKKVLNEILELQEKINGRLVIKREEDE
jgi:hypothetical protein